MTRPRSLTPLLAACLMAVLALMLPGAVLAQQTVTIVREIDTDPNTVRASSRRTAQAAQECSP